jgi:hypothetical protein
LGAVISVGVTVYVVDAVQHMRREHLGLRQTTRAAKALRHAIRFGRFMTVGI